MNFTVEKVLERLVYEKLLLANIIKPKKRMITLKDVLEAAKIEPRIAQVLPAILIYKPKILKNISKDLKKYPEIYQQSKHLFDPKREKNDFLNIPIPDCRKAALAFENYLRVSRRNKRDRLFNLRLNDADWQMLEYISKARDIPNYSEMIRTLIHEAGAETRTAK